MTHVREPAAGRHFDLSLGQRLALGFGLAAVLLLGIAAVSLAFVQRTTELRRRLTDVIAPRVEASDRLERTVFDVGIAARNVVLVPSPERLHAFEDVMLQLHAHLAQLEAMPKDPDGRVIFADVPPLLEQFAARAEALVQAADRGESAHLDGLEQSLASSREALLAQLERYSELQDRKLEAARKLVGETQRRASNVVIVITGLLLLLLAVVAFLVVRAVRRPALRLVAAARSLGAGDYGPALALPPGDAAPEALRDELSELTRAFAWMTRELRAREEHLRAQSEQIQSQHEELQSQHEELQAQHEELQAQGEELSSQRDELQRSLGVAEASEERLRESDTQKNEFLAVLSHELRNPLAPIRNCLHLLGRVPPGSPQAARALEIIDRQVGHLTRLVDDLLDLARISRGKMRLQAAPLELGHLVRQAGEDAAALLASRGLALHLELPEEPVTVEGDAARLTQVVGNLLQNAAKFTPGGGRVTVQLESDGPIVRLRVTDTGAGMDAATLERLFQPFMQAHSTLARTDGGLGLGLALVKRIVDMHAGSVRAHSEGPGLGSELTIELPRAQGATAAEATTTAPRTSRRRVLVVDDNVDQADSLRDALELAGHEVDVAYGGLDGLRRARDWRPDVVLCDLGLPDVDGHEVARRLTADPVLGKIYLVALSGYALPEDRRRAAEAGFREHLAKPASFARLEEVLAQVPERPREQPVS